METLLEAIVSTNSQVAIIDITGVPTVDTVVAQHLLKTVTAARLMGADCIISGIRPQIAQTIVHLGINLLDITTKATLRDAFALALERTGQNLLRERRLRRPAELLLRQGTGRKIVSTVNPVYSCGILVATISSLREPPPQNVLLPWMFFSP
jgi:anti-anti-sigma regulatory factor